MQDADIANLEPWGIRIPDTPGQCILDSGILINRMNRTQASIWHLTGETPADPEGPAFTDVTDVTVFLALFGQDVFTIAENRRLRFVQLYEKQGNLSNLILIREFRSGTNSRERSPLTVAQLLGKWSGTACTVYSDWTPSATYSTSLEIKDIGGGLLQQQLSFGEKAIISKARIEGKKLLFGAGDIPRQILLLPDGTSSNTPLQVKLRQPFFVEVGWVVEDDKRQRLIRSYDEKGAWVSATHIIERKVG